MVAPQQADGETVPTISFGSAQFEIIAAPLKEPAELPALQP
jgi:hypothetical protein